MSAPTHPDSPFARWTLRACALWLATGALAKLYYGNPALLPALIREHTPISVDATYTLVIGIELALVGLALLRPRQAWPLFVALFAFFDLVLTTQIAAGAASCGCFGKSIDVPPALMMAIDSLLLAALLFSRPWIALRSAGAGIGLVLPALLLAFVAPAIKVHERLNAAPVVPAPGPGKPTAEQPPAPHPDWLTLDPTKWVGKSIYDISELTKYVPEEKLPTDGVIVLWRATCDHCANHLREMANGDHGQRPITLVQIQDDPDGATPIVDVMPEGAHVSRAEFPKGMTVVLETPWEITVEGGNVTKALDRAQLEAPK